MTSVISLRPTRTGTGGDAVIHAVAGRLGVVPTREPDGCWDFAFPQAYGAAHAAVTGALTAVDPDWPDRVTLEYALAV